MLNGRRAQLVDIRSLLQQSMARAPLFSLTAGVNVSGEEGGERVCLFRSLPQQSETLILRLSCYFQIVLTWLNIIWFYFLL